MAFIANYSNNLTFLINKTLSFSVVRLTGGQRTTNEQTTPYFKQQEKKTVISGTAKMYTKQF